MVRRLSFPFGPSREREPKWDTYQEQGTHMCPRGHTTMEGQLLGYLLPSGQLDVS